MRFSLNPKEAFKKLQTVTKYHCFEKRDGSIISKVKEGETTISAPDEVNILLKNSLQNLCGTENSCTLTKSKIFPHLNQISIKELREIVDRLSQNKAIAEDFCEDSVLWKQILNKNDDRIAEIFTHLWESKTTNTKEFERHLTGRLVPLNKVHPNIPKPDEMRPIIALSPILKLVESRFRDKLENYMTNQMMQSQVGFVRNCGTHVNIVRLIKRCLTRYNGIGNLKSKFKPKALLFIDFKSAYNNVNLDMLFANLLTNNILDSDEVEFLRTLYSKTVLTVGNQKVEINKGVMQGSIISPALFNIFIEPMLKLLNREFNMEDIFAYADDIAICIYSIGELHKAINIINKWSNEAGIPINFRKSGILNIIKNTKTHKIAIGDNYMNYPIVDKYKYLGVWLDEKLNPETHLKSYKPKINYLISRFRMIPKKSITPRYLINIWTLIIRPIYDYAFCLAKLKNITGEKKYIAEEMQSFKKLMSLRKTTSNELIKDLIGYDPEKLCLENIRRAEQRWTERKSHVNQNNDETIKYRRQTSNTFITWNMLWHNNLLFSKCENHNTIITPNHIKNFHNITNLPNLSTILFEDYVLHEKIKKSKSKRKGRIYKIIQSRTQTQDKIAKDIIQLFNSNSSHF